MPLVNPAWPVLPIYMVPNVAASLLTTARDYARFLAHVVGRPPVRPGSRSGPTTREAMTTPAGPDQQRPRLGARLGASRTTSTAGRSGTGAPTTASATSCLADPTNGRAIVVLTNSGNGPRVYERVIVVAHRPRPPRVPPRLTESTARGARPGRPAVLVSAMRDQHRPKQDLINEVIALRKQMADLREAMTARRRVEDALRQSEEQLRTLMDAAPVGLCLFRPNGTPLAANRPSPGCWATTRPPSCSGSPIRSACSAAGKSRGGCWRWWSAGLERVAGVVFRRKDGTRQAFGVIGAVSSDPHAVVLVVLERQPQPWRSAPLAALSPAWSAPGSRTG